MDYDHKQAFTFAGYFLVFAFVVLVNFALKCEYVDNFVSNSDLQQYQEIEPVEATNSQPFFGVNVNNIQVIQNVVKEVKAAEAIETFDRYSVEIPKIGLEHTVVANVDAAKKDEYLEVIESNVAHGKYTMLPEEITKQGHGLMYIFAHRFGAHGIFNRIGELEIGDKIYIHSPEQTYTFVVTKSYYQPVKDTSVFTPKSEVPMLRMQSCTVEDDLRLMVDAELKKVENLYSNT